MAKEIILADNEARKTLKNILGLQKESSRTIIYGFKTNHCDNSVKLFEIISNKDKDAETISEIPEETLKSKRKRKR